MNADILQQEILLVTGTTFSQRELSSLDGANDSKELSEQQYK